MPSSKGKPDKPPGKPEKPPVIIVIPPTEPEPPVIINPPTVESHQLTGQRAIPMVGILTPGQGVAVATSSTRATATTAVGGLAPSSSGGTPTPTPEDDFILRRNSPGVFRWFDFNQAADLGVLSPPVTGQVGNDNFGRVNGTANAPAVNATYATLDAATKASGASSLRFDIPDLSGDSACGWWFTNFSSDLSVRFGENSEFFFQFRWRCNPAFMTTALQDVGGGIQAGMKLVICDFGDTPTEIGFASSAMEIVIQSFYTNKFAFSYQSGSAGPTHSAYSGLFDRTNGNYNAQNGMPSPFCLVNTGTEGQPIVPPGCWGFVPDNWMTFQMRVKCGPYNPTLQCFDNSIIQIWSSYENGPTSLILDWNPSVPGYFPITAYAPATNRLYGKLYLVPWMTNKNRTQTHPTMTVWYDELIMSSQRIPDPGSTTLPTVNPEWGGTLLSNRPLNAWIQIPGTIAAGSVTDPSGSPSIPLSDSSLRLTYGGGAMVGTEIVLPSMGGHAAYRWNEVTSIDIGLDTPAWRLRQPRSDPPTQDLPYNVDGKPSARQGYASIWWSSHWQRVMLHGTRATWPNGFSHWNSNALRLDGTTGCTWDMPGFMPTPTGPHQGQTVSGWADAIGHVGCKDSNGDIWALNGNRNGLCKWTEVTDTWSNLPTFAASIMHPLAHDPTRDELFALAWGDGEDGGYTPGQLNAWRLRSGGTVCDAITFNPSAGFTQFNADRLQMNGMFYDTFNNRYLFMGGAGAPGTGATTAIRTLRIYSIVPNSSTVWDISVYAPSGAGPTVADVVLGGTYTRFQIVPELKGFFYMRNGIENIWFVRLA